MNPSRNILIIDDSEVDQAIIKATLSGAFNVTQCLDLKSAREALKVRYDLIVLDILLPDGNGFDFYSEFRTLEHINQAPVIFLTSKDSESDIIRGLSLGAEDFVTKPFSPTELKIRIEKRIATKTSIISAGNLRIDINKQQVTLLKDELEPKIVDLKRNEFKLLLKLIESPEKIYTRERLLDEICTLGEEKLDRNIDTYISRIRKKIKGATIEIKTIYGVGYQISELK